MTNLERMIELAEEFFATKNDSSQISVTPEIIDRLRAIHPATLAEKDDGTGPVAWILIIPTTHFVMEQFITKKINEQELLNHTPPGITYDSLYFCSALVLPEHRGKGLAKRLLSEAIASIQRNHPIRDLFYWAFSTQGEQLAASIAQELGLPLWKRPE